MAEKRKLEFDSLSGVSEAESTLTSVIASLPQSGVSLFGSLSGASSPISCSSQLSAVPLSVPRFQRHDELSLALFYAAVCLLYSLMTRGLLLKNCYTTPLQNTWRLHSLGRAQRAPLLW